MFNSELKLRVVSVSSESVIARAVDGTSRVRELVLVIERMGDREFRQGQEIIARIQVS